MKKLLDVRLLCAFVALFALVACNKDTDVDVETPTPDVEITFPDYKSYTYSADQEISITFVPAEMWSMSADQSWVKFNYDGATQSTISGPAGQESVTVALEITPQESLAEDQSAIITLKIGDESEAVVEVIQKSSFSAADFVILAADSGAAVSEATLEWSETALKFINIITVEAPFDWVISDYPEWFDAQALTLSGEAGVQSRLLLYADMNNYPATAESGNMRIESKANSEIYVDFELHVEDCSNEIFVLDGYTIINNSVDFDALGLITNSLSYETSESVSFTVMTYGDQAPDSFLLQCWYEEDEVILTDNDFLYESSEFFLEIVDSEADGNFIKYTYELTSQAGDPAMAQILLFPSSMELYDIDQLESYLWYEFGTIEKLYEEMDPFKFGVVTRDGGPKDDSAMAFSFVYGEWATGASLKFLSDTHGWYNSYIELVESPSNLYHLTYDYPSAQSMAMISASGYVGNLDTSEVTVSDSSWLGYEYMGGSFQITVNSTAITSYPIEGYVVFKNEGSTLYDYIFHVTVTAAQ
ncbi:MAG: hypothetical protein SNI51_01140 [Rikenellaceae bacterium]